MRRIGYSSGMKAVAIMLQELFSVMLVTCIILISTLFDRSMLEIGDFGNKEFTQCGYYESLFRGAVKEVLEYSEYQKRFETDGAYNPEKVVYIMAYNDSIRNNSNIRASSGGIGEFRYYLGNLEDWAKEYTKLEYRVDSRLYLDSDGAVHQLQQVYIEGETIGESDTIVSSLQEVDSSLLEVIVSDVEYYYGGNYNSGDYLSGSSAFSITPIFSDVYGSMGSVDAGQEKESYEEMDKSGTGGTDSEDVSRQEQKVFLDGVIQKVRAGKLFELGREELKAVLEDLKLADVVASAEREVLDEEYTTVNGTTILEEYLNGAITLQEMQQAYDSLSHTLNTIGNEITTYKRMLNKYNNGDSNLQFWICSEKPDQYYTNITEAVGRDELLDYGKELGSYFYYNDDMITLNTNVEGMADAFYEELEAWNNGNNSVIFVAVDKDFPYEDTFYKAKMEYNQLQPWTAASMVGAVISVFGCFLSFVYLSLAAGRNSEDMEIHLNWFDKIKTEILLFGFFGVCVVGLFVFQELIRLSSGSDVFGMMIMGGGLTFTVIGIFMIFYMSFIRRIKAAAMWRGSILYWIGSGIQKVVQNWKPSVRILLVFGGHVILTLMMALTAIIWRRQSFVIFLMMAAYLLLCAAEAVFFLREGVQRNVIIGGIKRIAGGDLEYEIDTNTLRGANKAMGEAVNTIGEGLYHAVDDSIKNERLKTDLITNVSHDIKTPLTSIINYVDLLKRENLDNERVKSYIHILDTKSQRLKQLTEDLVEASKVSSGNIKLQMDRLNFVELVYQTAGEFNEKFEARGLTAVTRLPKEPVVIVADGRRIWRVIENLYNNVAKYAMENTRVYVDMEVVNGAAAFSIKNISEQPLNIDASELTERFIRGDVSRSTEGSGLGLSIASSLTQLMGGTFDIYLDGDLFKVTVTFPVADKEKQD